MDSNYYSFALYYATALKSSAFYCRFLHNTIPVVNSIILFMFYALFGIIAQSLSLLWLHLRQFCDHALGHFALTREDRLSCTALNLLGGIDALGEFGGAEYAPFPHTMLFCDKLRCSGIFQVPILGT